MTPVPPPESPCLRVRMIFNNGEGQLAGNRFYLSYSGSAPTAANCATLAGDIETAYVAHLAPLQCTDYDLVEIDVLDIATDDGASGNWTGSTPGTRSGTVLPLQIATNVEFEIARRYRGGKPRMFMPPGVDGDLSTQAAWSNTFTAAVNTGVAAFFTAIEALSIGAIGTLAHVNLSYYQGFTNITTSSGRERAVPKYRTAAKVDPVTGYSCKAILGSQRRRRTATTP